MKKLLFILLLIPILSFSQAKIGYTKSALIKELTSHGYEVREIEHNSNHISLIVQIDTLVIVSHSIIDDFSYSSIIIPKDKSVINYYIKRYNEEYVPTAHNKWLAYLQHYICEIELVYDEDLGYVIVWIVKE